MNRQTVERVSQVPILGLVAWLLAAGNPSFAQDTSTVYRCGDGRYSQTPCPGGTRLAAGSTPTPEQQRETQQGAERERQLAEQLRAERHAREKAATAGAPARIGPPAAAASKPAKAASKPHEPHKKRKKHQQSAADGPDGRRAYAPKPKD